MGGRQRNWRAAVLGLAFGLAATAPLRARIPHVWITVKSQIKAFYARTARFPR